VPRINGCWSDSFGHVFQGLCSRHSKALFPLLNALDTLLNGSTCIIRYLWALHGLFNDRSDWEGAQAVRELVPVWERS
jgi:hypothetical protein